MNSTTTSKAHQAIRRYLEMKDFEVIEESWAHGQDSIDFIARDGDALAFIATQVNENAGEGFPETGEDRDVTDEEIARVNERFGTAWSIESGWAEALRIRLQARAARQ